MTRLNKLPFENRIPLPYTDDITSTGFGLGLASLTLGQALQAGSGFYSLPAFFWLTASLICLAYALIVHQKELPLVFKKIASTLLILGLLWQIIQLANTFPPVYYAPSSSASFWRFSLGIAVAGCFALLSLMPETRISPLCSNIFVGLTLLVVLFVGTSIIKMSPSPFIDTFVFQQTSSNALLRGENPYTLLQPNIYGDMRYYGAELVNDGNLTIGNPYPPISIYFSTLGYIAGKDIRYSHLLAIVLSAALIAFLQPGQGPKLAAYIFLFTPRVFYVLESSWTEPIVVFFLTLAIFCAFHRPRWLPVTIGLLFASKQYFVFLIPLTLLLIPPKPLRWDWLKFYGWMSGVGLAVTAPLALWNIPAFLWNVGGAQWYQVFRLDALSYLTLYARIFHQTPSSLISFVALIIGFFFVRRFAPRTPIGFVISVAWCLEIFFAFNKQAFCNYYFLVIGTICCALAALSTQQPVTKKETYSPEQGINHE